MTRRYLQKVFCLCMLALGLVLNARAQTSPSLYDYPRPELDWYTIETEHFLIHFHEEEHRSASSRTAQVVARVAEEIYGPVTHLYRHEPNTKVSIVLIDYADYSNGAAYFFDNMIKIWVPYLNSHLRGDHNWLRNVITHEFTHIIQIQTAMKATRRWPFAYLQYFSYEDVRRPDVLYGYPDGLVSYPIPTVTVPAWFAEGTAQYQRADIHYDTWDSHRDMLLRTQVLAGRTLDLPEMGGFYSHNSLERESVYNHGYAFTRYLAATYGEEALREISRELSEWDNVNIKLAITEALGTPAEQVFGEWKQALERGYKQKTRQIRPHQVAGRIIEGSGFSNFYPQFSPDGSRVAYLSNKGQDFNIMSLYVRDLETGEVAALPVELPNRRRTAYHCALGNRLITGVNGAFDWHPDGHTIVYARISDTRDGFRYSDLYAINLETHERARMTNGRRASAPAYSPNGSSLVFVGQKGGTANLFKLNLESGRIRRLTSFPGGTQVSNPVWHPSGEWIYFSRTTGQPRDLYRIRPDGSQVEPVLVTPADERSPAFDPSGDYLYFASDRTGIFNIYRRPVGGTQAQAVTNVIGGAFMPSVNGAGDLVYARYEASGYHIAHISAASSTDVRPAWMQYEPPAVVREKGESIAASYNARALNTFDDTDIEPLQPGVIRDIGDGDTVTSLTGASEAQPMDTTALSIRPYQRTFTSFSVFPVLRIDQYAQKSASFGQRLLHNTKAGIYVDSREVLGDMRFFGGIALGWASEEASSVGDFFSPSRLISLERDAFIQFDYMAGLPFISARWSPQFSVQLRNIRRNVEDGLAIEEFPCTACYPDTTYTDVSYGIWEFRFLVRSKVNQSLLLELGYRYSPYRVRTEPFYSREYQQVVSGSSDQYFIGRALTASAYFEQFHPYRHADVLPEGMRLAGGYEYQPGRLLEKFAIEEGRLVPEFRQYNNHRLWMQSYIGMRLPGRLQGAPHGVSLRLHASTILGSPVDDFFNSYVGGLTGARGYPFYALGGNETIWLQLSYYVPLIPSIDRQLLFLYADKLYARIYADAAMAWEGAWPGISAVRKDVGAELRLGLGSFYLLPTAVFVSATYGLDRFDVALSEGFITPAGRRSVSYGREWLWHFGVVFDFDFDL